MRSTDTFRFKQVSLSDIQNEIKSLNPNKATTHNNVPPKILRQSVEATADSLQLLLTNALLNSELIENIKSGDVTAIFKKKIL